MWWVLASLLVHVDAINFLVFGGNGNVGSHVTLALIESGYNVTAVNRGNWANYFDAEIRIKPRLQQHIVCDRYDDSCGTGTGATRCNPLLKCEDLLEYAKETPKFYVVDFSAYDGTVIQDAIQVFKDKIELYVYISSDSVYEVSDIKDSHPSLEKDANRPVDEHIRQRLNELDSYGHGKLHGEEVLQEEMKTHNASYVILRLPDVYGPRDSTNRWWPIQLYIKYYDYIREPFRTSKKITGLKTSWIYVNDVSQALHSILADTSTWNDVYNLASDGYFNVPEYIFNLSRFLNVPGVKVVENAEDDFAVWLPSVLRGMVNITKAKQKLSFVPTPWETAMSDTVAFYEKAFILAPHRRNMALDSIIKILPESKRKALIGVISGEIETVEQHHNEL